MDNFSHFLITRFNLRLFPVDKKNAPTRTDAWLAGRFDIFEEYCLPSVAGQTCKDFVWLCLFDAATPEMYRARIEGYREVCPQFVPVFYDEVQTGCLAASLDNTIRGIIAGTGAIPETVMTTNLDNDDSLSIYAMEKLQEQARLDAPGKPRVYSFLYGYQYFTGPRLMAGMRYTNNHFLTLSEPYGKEELKTIISFRHATIIKEFETLYLDTPEGMWLEVVHSNNVANEFRINSKVKYILLRRSRDFSDFGIGLRVTGWKQFWKSVFLFPKYFVTTGIRRLATKKQRRKAK